MTVVRTEALTKDYPGGVRAVSSVSLEVGAGCIFGFLGPNGAGKTTTVRLLNGSLEPTSGRSFVLGMESSREEVRSRTATLTEAASMYAPLTVEENLRFFATMYGMTRTDTSVRVEELLRRMHLWERRGDKLGALSTGLRKRAQLARTLLHRPRLVFLDEPTSGLDPDSSLQVTALIQSLARENETTVFLCTHNLPLAERICDRLGFIRGGELVAEGTSEDLVESVRTRKSVTIRTTEETRSHPYSDDTEITAIVSRLIRSGSQILEVVRDRPTLEDVYFHYVGRTSDELV